MSTVRANERTSWRAEITCVTSFRDRRQDANLAYEFGKSSKSAQGDLSSITCACVFFLLSAFFFCCCSLKSMRGICYVFSDISPVSQKQQRAFPRTRSNSEHRQSVFLMCARMSVCDTRSPPLPIPHTSRVLSGR